MGLNVPSQHYDLVATYLLIAVTVGASLAYLIRLLFWGKVKYARVERQGGSVLLSKSLMAMAYWSITPIGRLLVFLKIHPHYISWTSLWLGIAAGIALGMGRLGLGAILATISAFLDTLDGMVARMMKVDSNTGEILDTTVDRYCEFFFVGGLVIYYRENLEMMIIALFALAGSFLVSYSTAKAEALNVTPSRGIMRRPERAFYLILGAALSPIAIRYFEAGVENPLGYPLVFALILVAVLTNISTIDRMFSIVKQLKVIEAKDKDIKDNEPVDSKSQSLRELNPAIEKN